MPGNYNALVGYGFNPYDPVDAQTRLRRLSPRWAAPLSPGGSSSGAGTAANFWAANVGTETSGSILTPANQTMLVGIKPTVGRISRHGIIPITADQDTAGPMARTVADAAVLLGVLEGRRAGSARSRDEGVPASAEQRLHALSECARLDGARIGIPRAAFLDEARHGAVAARRHRGAEAAGRHRRRPGGHPGSAAAGVQRAAGLREGRELLGCLQVRDEARFQHVARVAGPSSRSRR